MKPVNFSNKKKRNYSIASNFPILLLPMTLGTVHNPLYVATQRLRKRPITGNGNIAVLIVLNRFDSATILPFRLNRTLSKLVYQISLFENTKYTPFEFRRHLAQFQRH